MASKTTRISENLSWTALKENFYIGSITVGGQKLTVNKLQDAIDDGTLKQMLIECADEYHDGDLVAVLNILKRNLSSQLCNMRKRASAGYTSNYETDKIRYETLKTFVDGLMSEHVKPKSGISANKPQWAYGPEEIDQIDDPELLRKVINSIADPCSDGKNPAPYIARFGENYREIVIANREYARERLAKLKAEASKPKVSDALQQKILNGNGRLTKAELEELTELLKRLER